MAGSEPPELSGYRFTQGPRMDGLFTVDNERIEKRLSADPSNKCRVCGFRRYKLQILNSLQNRHQQTSPPLPLCPRPGSPPQASKTPLDSLQRGFTDMAVMPFVPGPE